MSDRPAGVDPGALVVRRAEETDIPGVLELARRSLGWPGGADDAAFFHWKHRENPFGESPMWVATDGERIAGFRTFLRWRFERPDGSTLVAVRAVDTATAPDYQGHGIFTRLTLGALDELRAEGVELVFNTPNAKSLPGYLKMGWSAVGRLPTAVMLPRLGSLFALATAREAASLSSIAIGVGERAADAFADQESVLRLLVSLGPVRGVSTARTPQFLLWRYGFEPLRYRVMLHGPSLDEGLAVFRLRRRGRAVEAVVCDVLVPDGDQSVAASLLRSVARDTGASYLLRIDRPLVQRGPFLRVPRTGPILAFRPLDGAAPPALHDWSFTMGDVELF